MGVSDASRMDFMKWSKALIHVFNPQATPQQQADFEWARQSCLDYFQEIVNVRRAERGSDFISALITAEENEQLTEWEIISTCELLLFAGNVTTTDLIGNGMLALLQHPEQMQKLRTNPALMPSAIEEMLRYDTPINMISRVTTDSTRVGGCPFRAGESLAAMVDAANHDPALHENPHGFDVERENKRHYSFGGGAHFCLGAPLARAEGEIAFAALLEYFPNLALDASRPYERKFVPAFSGLVSLWLTV